MEHILSEGTLAPSCTHTFLRLYARYLYHEKKLQKNEIVQKLDSFLEHSEPHYQKENWAAPLEQYAAKASTYPLCKCDGVWMTDCELQTILALHDKVLERLAFTLLCLAKFRDFKNPKNDHWISNSNGEIYSIACINTTAFEKDNKLHLLKELGLIAFAKKVDNLNIRILFVEETGKKELFVSDFRKLGYEWRLYKGEKYIRCTACGILAKNTNGKRKYCVECSKRIDLQKAKERMKKIRNL